MNSFVRESLVLVLVISGVPLLCSTFCALFVAVLQSAMQLQEQTLSFLVRFLAVVGALYCSADWIGRSIVTLFKKAFLLMASIQSI